MDYVEQFQRIESAMVLAKIQLSDLQKAILEKSPKNLDEAYKVVLTLRQAKTLAADPTGQGIREYESHPSRGEIFGYETWKREEKTLRALTGMAWDEECCLNYGSSKHKRRNCPDNLNEPGVQKVKKKPQKRQRGRADRYRVRSIHQHRVLGG
eukprot:387330-Rhodomonas_salina.1